MFSKQLKLHHEIELSQAKVVLGVGAAVIFYTIYNHWGINVKQTNTGIETEESDSGSPRVDYDQNLLEETKSEDMDETQTSTQVIVPTKVSIELISELAYVQLMKEIFYR